MLEMLIIICGIFPSTKSFNHEKTTKIASQIIKTLEEKNLYSIQLESKNNI
jgi:hypothetical protein